MNCEEFLRWGGTDMDAVLARVHAAVGLGAGDMLLAVGSLAEGMGTSRSDFDLLWIADRRARALPAEEHLPLRVGQCLVDVQVWPRRELEVLLERFEAWARAPWDVMHQARFSLDDRTSLHRLSHGRVMHAGSSQPVAGRIPARRDLARLKLQIARHWSRTIQVDLAGYRELEDYGTLTFAAQDLLGHVVDGLLAAHGWTNPLVKWRSRLLDEVPADWEPPLGTRPTGLTARERVWRLHRAPARPSRRAVLAHAADIAAFARAVFPWAERVLVHGRPPQPRGLGFVPEARGKRTRALPSLDLDVDLCFLDGGFVIGRLNDFGRTLRLSAAEGELLRLFDGRTTTREAERLSGGGGRRRANARTIERLVEKVAQAGFTSPP